MICLKKSAKNYCGEPDLINPNSFQSISQILRNLGRKAGIKRYDDTGKREWLFLEVDGTIYNIISQLIEKTFRCENCDQLFYISSKTHPCNASKHREFDWIILFPGKQ